MQENKKNEKESITLVVFAIINRDPHPDASGYITMHHDVDHDVNHDVDVFSRI